MGHLRRELGRLLLAGGQKHRTRTIREPPLSWRFDAIFAGVVEHAGSGDPKVFANFRQAHAAANAITDELIDSCSKAKFDELLGRCFRHEAHPCSNKNLQ